MKNYSLIILFALIFLSDLKAQQKFSQSIGGPGNDEALYCKPTNDGGYINVGWTTSYGAGNWDLYLVKTNSAGQIMWTRTYGGAGDEADCSVEQTSDKGYIIASRTNSFSVGSSDIYIVKTDSLGNLVWSKTYGGSAWEEGHSIIILNDGYVHVGFTSSFGAGNDDIYLMKSDFNGNMLWAKTFGGTATDHGHKVKLDLDGSILIAGATNSFNPNNWDFYLLKISTLGSLLWSKIYVGAGDDIGWDVQPVTDGYYVAGYTNSAGAGANDFLLIKTDVQGNVQWSKTYGGPNNEQAFALEKTLDNNLLITGETESYGNGDEDIFIIKTDNLGNVLWAKTYGGLHEDGSQYGQNAVDSGYIISGYTQSFGGGNWDFYMIKTDQEGYASGCNMNDIVIEGLAQSINSYTPATQVASASFLTGSNPNTIVSVGGDAYICSPLGTASFMQTSFELFPIPAQDKLILKYSNVEGKGYSILNYTIKTMQGQLLVTGNFNAKSDGSNEINISELAIGIYFITLYQNDEAIYVQKLIKN